MRLGIDVGGTKTAAVVLGDGGTILTEFRRPTGIGPKQVVETVVGTIREAALRVNVAIDGFESVGVGIPGSVDSASGRVSNAVNLALSELALRDAVAAQTGCLVHLDNDVKVAAYGARELLARPSGRYPTSLAYLNLGTGLAAGVLHGSSVWRGASGNAGEIGHLPLDTAGVLCNCGQYGCLETVSSGSAIARQWPVTSGHPAVALLAAARAGNPEALSISQSFFRGVAAAVRILTLSCDVEAIVIGGGLSALGDELIDGVVRQLREESMGSPFLRSLALERRLHLVPLGHPVAAVGAALAAIDASSPAEAVIGARPIELVT